MERTLRAVRDRSAPRLKPRAGVLSKLRRARNPRRKKDTITEKQKATAAALQSASATQLITELNSFGADSESFATLNAVHVHDLRLNMMVRLGMFSHQAANLPLPSTGTAGDWWDSWPVGA
jgi:hypothetical protein